MNVNTQFTWLQFIGMKLFQASDLPAPDSKRIAVRRNGSDPARDRQEDYGSFVHLQPLNFEFVDKKMSKDSQGNLYKKVRPDVNWAYRGGDLDRYARDGWGKQTNGSENQSLRNPTGHLFASYSVTLNYIKIPGLLIRSNEIKMTKAGGITGCLGVEHGNGMGAQYLCGQRRQGTQGEPDK